MDSDVLRLAYYALQDRSCVYCGDDLNYNRIQLELSETNNAFEAEYVCSCGNSQDFVVTYDGDHIQVEIIGSEEDSETYSVATGALERLGSEVHPIYEALDELLTAYRVLKVNWKHYDYVTKELPNYLASALGAELDQLESKIGGEVVIKLPKSKDMGLAYAVIHNYLSSVYSFDQVLETTKADLIWDEKISHEFSDFMNEHPIVRGLRIFTQHERIPSVSLKLNHDDSNVRVSDFLIDLDEVDTITSEINESQPDGYKHGADKYYSKVEGGRINLSQNLVEYQYNASKLMTSLTERFYNEERDLIEEYESIEIPDTYPDEIADIRDSSREGSQ
ncbi:hypothetical protein [Halobaculum magnesiiphilum]|uniref:Uncharacterized protein n=1 Tax=Halobaculum magnesiiphilum TaxID=1017351 RepID=A0A8T8WD48_9EURY|nr:hypothetical protein [Halobaculum magnesiiphilum]QZP37768.1 hypothetical protein K6T50_00880 [Halobaculum magnesiiphilum]